jgi:hypothetical protein
MISTEIHLEGSKTMPAITFKNGRLNIIGRSIPCNSKEWFEPLMKVLMLYAQDPFETTEINIELDYLNSDSNRSMLNLLHFAEQIHGRGKNVIIKWFYKNNDSSMYDQGNIFSSLIEVPFNFEPVN